MDHRSQTGSPAASVRPPEDDQTSQPPDECRCTCGHVDPDELIAAAQLPLGIASAARPR